MVSFQCENCGDVLTKKRLDSHRNYCHGSFTCIDCLVHFPGTEYRAHTSCMTEDQKYQGHLYKPKKDKRDQNKQNSQQGATNIATPSAPIHPTMATHVEHRAYVEDAPEDYLKYQDFSSDDDEEKHPPPRAPTPPSATETPANINVFDFLVANPTPKASNSDLRGQAAAQEDGGSQVVRFEYTAGSYQNPFLDQAGHLVHAPPSALVTPAPKAEKKKHKDGDVKKDKKRKRLHVDTRDSVMTDAPPVLHSGLTGGLKGLMSGGPLFPPSPEYSADAAETPASPLKKSRHSKHVKNSLMGMLTASSKPKSKKRKHSSPDGKKHTSSSHRHRHQHSSKPTETMKQQGLLEYRPSKDNDDASTDGKDDKAVVVFNPKRPAELLFSFVNKGPESEKGCSMNKALKRYHRERSASGSGLGKLIDEKDLFRSLRMRKNDRGEIVLFSV